MRRAPTMLPVVLLLLALLACPSARAQTPFGMEPAPGTALFSPAELEDLLAPVALYPDPLLAQILPASTFLDQIDEAARFVRLYGVTAGIDAQDWDVSVKAVAHYPEVLFMMDREYDWTAALGQAFVNQETEVMDAIQRLRAEAAAQGNLVSTPQQEVVVNGGIIRILPASPDVIYVPLYDPLVVYLEPPPSSSGFIFFGSGFVIGAWLNRDCDWHHHRVYYHGWRGGGWVGRARPHLHLRKNVYINHAYADIHINRKVTQRNTLSYRRQIREGVKTRRERTVRQPSGDREERPLPPAEKRPARARPSPVAPRPRVPTDNREVYRGRDLHRTQPPSQTGYGGYGSGKDATRYRERGRRSLENMQRLNRPAPQRRPTPVRRPGASAGKPGRKPAGRSAPRREPQGKAAPKKQERSR